MEFYVSIKGKKSGPFTNYDISGMLREGEIDGDSLVWMRGQDGWKKLREVPALKSSTSDDDDLKENVDADDPEGNHETQEGNPLPNTKSSKSKITIPIAHEVRPLTRFWARSFDYFMVTVFVWGISDITPPTLPADSTLTFGDLRSLSDAFWEENWKHLLIVFFYGQFCWHIIEGLLLHVFGTTPGKALFGIKIRTKTGQFPSIYEGIARSFYVYIAGVGMYFGILFIICMALGFFRLMIKGETFWDEHLKMTVEHPPLGFARIFLAIGAFLVLMIVHSLKFS